ncbi:FAD-binding domain-containing protein [Comamonas testosteroni]|uniref:cryptochrome/deoxyribodipyrimidine photo-lyase family protein n=1 Tax=Comamonas testosteroni TaxID=285 RepID=UPI00265EE4A2|nr:FAD-binding domain-containing protein [Comamonas testosteroni]WKL15558.1 FAD-binding domain-containing protein [Comamonas testosteroni]
MTYTVVWFKRDLRVYDHAPLAHAAVRGPVLCLYVLEPGIWRQPDCALQHYEFLRESLRDLAQQLRVLGARLQLAVGELTDVLSRLHAQQPFASLVSHQETGNSVTYARDLAVARWCRAQGVSWQEWPQHGVVRCLPSRDQWLGMWQSHMAADRVAAPVPASLRSVCLPWRTTWPEPSAIGLLDDHQVPLRQRGGRSAGQQVLDDFLNIRCANYRGGISSPLSAADACSRLSPYLSSGSLSMREVVQATQQQQLQLTGLRDPESRRLHQGLVAFMSRLHWHCHFIQKLESEPEIEWRNLHQGYDGLRESAHNADYFEALQAGRTGWPLVDACVAMLRETGWLNFRMRAMLVSVASFPLWLHWRPVGLWLARQFLDYEPGIHWSQMQMQAGTTGINALRVYNPLKQAKDHDPGGVFVRRWLPALQQVPDAWIFEPWQMPLQLQARCGVRVGTDIASPLVDLAEATRVAKSRVHSVRAQPSVRSAKAAILQKHGSRDHLSQRRKRSDQPPAPLQRSLEW